MEKNKVGVWRPSRRQVQSVEAQYALELESLASVADLIEISASTPEEFAAGAKDVDGVIVSWGLQANKQVIERLNRCAVIGVAGVGVDMVDVDAATAAGIVVTNVPDIFVEDVADHAMALLLNLAHRIAIVSRLVRDGQWWETRPLLTGIPRLYGQTLGLLAFGNIARCTARRAKSFGLRVIAHDPYVSELEITAAGVEPVGFHELLERSDYLSLHPPHNPETHHAIDAAALGRMKPTAVIINTARGPIIDEAALVDALRSGVIAGAGLDVLEHEPPSRDNPLFSMENVVVTPHSSAANARMLPETRRRVGREVALVLSGRWPMSCVNPAVLPRVPLERWQPYPMSRGPNR